MNLPGGMELRCSAIVIRQKSVLLVQRTRPETGRWVLPGGTPRLGESMATCARREVLEETGLHVDPSRVGFVLEVLGPDGEHRTVDIVFLASETPPAKAPRQQEAGLEPAFVALDQLHHLDLRPPLAGYLRRLAAHRTPLYAPYLANMWRPPEGTPAAEAASGTPARAPAADVDSPHGLGGGRP